MTKTPRDSSTSETGVRKNSWICTFNDMMTLLMVFFVLIFSLGTLDVQDIQTARFSLQSGLGIFEAGRKTSIGILSPVAPSQSGMREFRRKMQQSIDRLDSEDGIRVSYSDMGITISLDNTVLFRSGSAAVTSEGRLVLQKIVSNVLKLISNPVRIEGHTDNDPIHTEKYPSNWELSTARAVNVLKYLAEKGDILPKRLSAVGYGESKPLVLNDTEDHKRLNRRVEIVIVSNKS